MGISLEFAPCYSGFLASGIEYETNGLGSSLSILLGNKNAVGKTFRPFLEAGGYFTYPLKLKQTDFTIESDY